MQDWQLIRRYVDTQSQAAFAELVDRHLKLVYNTCLRDLSNPQMAEDAAQVVFLVLARKAAGLNKDISLAGWLFRTARFAAKTALRQEGRNKRREQRVGEAMLLNAVDDERSWGRIDGMLNDALDSLPATDREVVLLRYLEEMSYTEIGALLMTSENAATKRTMRALEKLRKYLTARHVAVTVASLGALLTAHAAEAAPIGSWLPLSQTISSSGAAVNLAGMNLPELTQGVIHQMFIAKLKVAILVGGVILGGVGLVPLMAHVHAAHQAKADAAESPQPVPVVLGPQEEKLLEQLAKYPVEIKSLSAHIQAHYTHRVPEIAVVRHADGSVARVPQATPSADQEGDWAFSGDKLYNSEIHSFEMDGSPIRERFYRNGHMWNIHENIKANGVPLYQVVTRDGLGGSQLYAPQAQGPLAYGYFDGRDWLASSLRKTGFKLAGSVKDSKYGPLVEVVVQETEGLNPRTIHLWLADNYGFVCVKRDTVSKRSHTLWEAASLEKNGKFWMPAGDSYLFQYDRDGTGLVLLTQYTERFTDIHVNDVPDSTFEHHLPEGTRIWAYDDQFGRQVNWIMDSAGNLTLKLPSPF